MIFDTISVKVRWKRWCRWNCDLRVCTKKCIFCRTESVTMTLEIMCTHAQYVTLGSGCKMACWASYRFLPFTVFSLGLPFCFSSYIIHVRCTSLTSPLILSLCGVVRECLLPCHVVTAKWAVSCTRITCIQPLSRCSLTCLASSFFSESGVVSLSLSSSLLFHHAFFFVSGVLAISSRTCLLACLIRASILHFSFRLHLFTSRCFVIGSPD